MFRTIISILLTAGPVAAAVWVAYDDGLAKFTDDGELILKVTRYRNPASIALDTERGRLWFVEQYDYTVRCIDATSGEEIIKLEDAVHPPPKVTTDPFSSIEADAPPGLAVDPADGSLWIADLYGHQVARLDENGAELWRTSDFHEPYAVAPVGDGSAWVVGGISDLFHLSAEGEIVYKRKKGLNEPRDLAVDAGRRLVWIAEYGNSRVLAVDYDGNLLRKVSVELPWSITVDPGDGAVWVGSAYDKVYKISSAGELEATADRFESPADAAAAPGLGVWVADNGDDRVVLLDARGERSLNIDGIRKPVSLAVE